MICSFKTKETERIWNLEMVRKVPLAVQNIGLRKLVMLNKSIDISDLRIPPANRLEKLNADREGQYSIRINDQWRICFTWLDGNAYDVEIVDYH
ncbi:MAG: type II toxin-antitoxin system RelE/ParE family toxin [Treponema sp.]|nr:type II toxin-antitoxin system RelE/ParE family toxin [Treponema sp.]